MNLPDAFEQAANLLGLDKQALNDFAAEDELGGWTYLGYWPGGSIWEVEGKFLYALVRALEPENVFESGTKAGCSATHMLTALKANKKGTLTSVDLGIDTDIEPEGYGALIPKLLKKKWTFHANTRTEDFLDSDETPFDFVFEDTNHEVDTTVAILSRLKARESVKVVVSHDICHPWSGWAMREAWTQVFGVQDSDWHTFCIEPSDCGLAIWRRG